MATLKANEMSNGQARDGKLPHEGVVYHESDPLPPTNHMRNEQVPSPQAHEAELSPYVQAQRRMEMEWLESEEQRLREREGSY